MRKIGLILVCLYRLQRSSPRHNDLIFKDEPAKEQSSDDNDIIKVNFKEECAPSPALFSNLPGADSS